MNGNVQRQIEEKRARVAELCKELSELCESVGAESQCAFWLGFGLLLRSQYKIIKKKGS